MKLLKLLFLRSYATVLHAIRPNAGITRLSFNRITSALFKGIEGPLEARMPSGVRIEIEPDEYHGRILWLVGSNDWKVSRTVNALLRPGDVLLDIGANLGSIGFEALERVGSNGAVHLFDPQTDIANRLEAAIQKAKLDRVTVHRVALSNEDGQVTLAGPAKHRGMATILSTDELDRPRERSEVVEMRETSSYLSGLVLGREFGVKIDIEGAEPRVLPGLFELPGLRFVVFEGDQNQRWLWDFFTGKGFAVFGLARTPLRSRVVPVTRFERWASFHDFVAVPAGANLPSSETSLQDLAARVTS
jgi:FkbM family methyltransferase